MNTINLELEELSGLERKFYWQATAHNIPRQDIAKLIYWQRVGAVDLNSFLKVENMPVRQLTRGDFLKRAWTNFRAACRFRLPLRWE